MLDRKFYWFGTDKIKIKYPKTIKIGLDETEIRKIEERKPFPMPLKGRKGFYFSGYTLRFASIKRLCEHDMKSSKTFSQFWTPLPLK